MVSNRGVGQRRGSIGDIDSYGGGGGGGGGNGAVHTIDTTRKEMSTAAVMAAGVAANRCKEYDTYCTVVF